MKTTPAGPPEEPFSEIWSFFIQSSGGLCRLEVGAPSPLLTEPIVRLPTDTRGERASPHRKHLHGWSPGTGARSGYERPLAPDPERKFRRLYGIWAGVPGIKIEEDVSQVPVIEVRLPTEVPAATEAPGAPPQVSCAQITDPQVWHRTPGCRWRLFLTRPGGVCEPERSGASPRYIKVPRGAPTRAPRWGSTDRNGLR